VNAYFFGEKLLSMSLTIDQWHQRYLQQARWTQDLRKYLFQKCKIAQATRILDVGCGTGVLEEELSRISAASMHGADINLQALEFARSYTHGSIYTVADGLSLPFQSAVFDISLCHFLLLWVNNAQVVLEEMVRVTKPGGYVMALAEPDYGGRIDYPGELAPIGSWQNQALQEQGASPLIGRQIRSIFASAGLEDVEAGILGAQWRKDTSAQEAELEWHVLAADLENHPELLEQAERLKPIELAARIAQQRVLFVPVFYAVGRVSS
jgi:ubiquinone/menaquinone biosynthesis C-methylase UbiE